ncbi:hypothetical protein DER29_6161 [Micromonospora sp. M71_S20]|nr:hypothetical protein DER29_6161 [Micromonospora sp. M71_S20]
MSLLFPGVARLPPVGEAAWLGMVGTGLTTGLLCSGGQVTAVGLTRPVGRRVLAPAARLAYVAGRNQRAPTPVNSGR